MQVDLSKAKAGDTVKFRCGGEAVIKRIEVCQEGPYASIEFDEAEKISYTTDGEHSSYTIFDITAIIPAQFDWSTAKWGMCFESTRWEQYLWFIGINPRNEHYMFVDNDGEFEQVQNPWSHLTRCHEHDVSTSSSEDEKPVSRAEQDCTVEGV